MKIEIETPESFRWDRLCRYWGRDPASASEKTEEGRLRLAIRLPSGPVAVAVEHSGGRLACQAQGGEPEGGTPSSTVSPHCPPAESRAGGSGPEALTRALRRMFGLELDPGPFERAVAAGPHARLIAGREGQTVPQVPNVWDGLVWVVAGQQISLAVAFALRRRLTQAFGSRLAEDLWAPPAAEALAGLGEEELYPLGFSRAKAKYLLGAARAVASGLDLESWRGKDSAEIEAGLLALHGLGPWPVHYLMMRAYGLPDQVPVGDAALVKSLARFFGLPERPSPKKTRELMEPFAPWRSLATFHFWAHLEKKP